MGYTLTIGEAAIDYDAEYLSVDIRAIGAEVPEAPTFPNDEMTGQTSSRSPSYTGWAEFCREAGPKVEMMFYGNGWDRSIPGYRACDDDFHRETPLLANHPGAQPLCQGDLDVVREARIQREQTNGGKQPGFGGWTPSEARPDLDPILARLIWLEFWIEWALKNCKVPILRNT